MRVDELAASIGLKPRHLNETIKRLRDWGYAKQTAPDQLMVYTRCPPLGGRYLERLPRWVQDAHERLLGDHLQQLAAKRPGPETERAAARMVERLNELQTRPAPGLEIGR